MLFQLRQSQGTVSGLNISRSICLFYFICQTSKHYMLKVKIFTDWQSRNSWASSVQTQIQAYKTWKRKHIYLTWLMLTIFNAVKVASL